MQNHLQRKYSRSRADCALKGESVYQNENQPKPKKSRKSQTQGKKETVAAAPTTAPQNEVAAVLESNDNNVITLPEENNIPNIPNNKIKTENDKIKRRRRRQIPNIKKETVPLAQQKVEVLASEEKSQPSTSSSTTTSAQHPSIKVEIIKNEPIQMPLFTTKTELYNDDEEDGEQLEVDFDQLLHSDVIDDSMDNIESMPLPPPGSVETPQSPTSGPMTESPIISDSSSSSSSSCLYIHEDNYSNEPMDIEAYYEGRTFVNLDDGSVTMVNDVNQQSSNPLPPPEIYPEQPIISQPTPSPSPPSLPPPPSPHTPLHQQQQQQYLPPQSPKMSTMYSSSVSKVPPPDLVCNDTCSSITSERELNEQDIEHILTELAEGSLVLVSTLDPDDPDKVLNEIFMVDKNTGDLCDEPLNIPDNIVQCILSVMS